MDEKTINCKKDLFNPVPPKKFKGTEEAKILLNILKNHLIPLREESEILVPSFSINSDMKNALYFARKSGRLIRGLEDAEKKLAEEKRGIESVDKKTVVSRAERISRMLIFSDDGSDRFYRQIERLINQHNPRLFAVRLDATAEGLGEAVFGPEKRARLLLLSHKDAVIDMFMAILKNNKYA